VIYGEPPLVFEQEELAEEFSSKSTISIPTQDRQKKIRDSAMSNDNL